MPTGANEWLSIDDNKSCHSLCCLRMRVSANHNPFPSLVLALHAPLQLPAFISSLFMKREAAFLHGKRIKSSPEAGAPQGDEAKIALTVEKELNTLG